MSHDWMPRRIHDKIALAKRWSGVLAEKAAAWEIPQPEVTILNTKITNTETVVAAAQSADASAGDRERARVVLADLVSYMRFMKARRFFVPPLDSVALVNLGIERDTVRTAHTEVHEEVENHVVPGGIRTLLVHFKILGVSHHAKPEGYDGAVTIWHISDEKPAAPENYKYHKMASRTPFEIEFTEEERGRKVWIQQCWQNERGITGKYSEAIFGYVP